MEGLKNKVARGAPLAKIVGYPEWLEDERYNTPRDKTINTAELIGLLDEVCHESTYKLGQGFTTELVFAPKKP